MRSWSEKEDQHQFVYTGTSTAQRLWVGVGQVMAEKSTRTISNFWFVKLLHPKLHENESLNMFYCEYGPESLSTKLIFLVAWLFKILIHL